MNEPLHEDDFFSYAVRLTAHRIRLADGLAALLVMGAVACVMILGVVIADHTVAGGLSVAARGVFRWGFLVVELGLAAWMLVMPLARRISDLYIARLLERANPSFRKYEPGRTRSLSIGKSRADPARSS